MRVCNHFGVKSARGEQTFRNGRMPAVTVRVASGRRVWKVRVRAWNSSARHDRGGRSRRVRHGEGRDFFARPGENMLERKFFLRGGVVRAKTSVFAASASVGFVAKSSSSIKSIVSTSRPSTAFSTASSTTLGWGRRRR